MSTVNDREILNSIFNPLLPNGSLQFDENVPVEIPELEEIISNVNISDDLERAKTLELEAIQASDRKEYEKSLELFSKSIAAAPRRASAYNNRAQTLRLLGKITEAREDLNNAINLSEGKGRAACQAFCQRGLINLKENRSEDAKDDFQAAAKLGSQFAKAQLVQMNPYAALCNKMLHDVYDKLKRGVPTDSETIENNGKQ